MALWLLAFFYFFMAGCEIARPERCLRIFERIISSARRIRILGLFMFFIAFLYYSAEPARLTRLISLLFWIYLFSGVWFAGWPRAFASLCGRSYTALGYPEKRALLYADCGIRTVIAVLLIYAV